MTLTKIDLQEMDSVCGGSRWGVETVREGSTRTTYSSSPFSDKIGKARISTGGPGGVKVSFGGSDKTASGSDVKSGGALSIRTEKEAFIKVAPGSNHYVTKKQAVHEIWRAGERNP